MRQIGFINEERDAARFGDYLLTLGIVSLIEETSGGAWAVWIENDDHLDRGRSELEQFRANAADPKYEVSSHAEKVRKQESKSRQKRQKQFVDVRTRWGQPAQLVRPVTIVLVAISVLASIGNKLGMSGHTPVENALLIAPIEEVGDDMIQWDDLNAIWHGQVWRLITPIFLHYGPIHLIFNMFWLLDLGSMIETRRGSVFLLVLALVTAAGSNIGEYYLPNPAHPSPMFGGMSGVVYALFGYVWIKGKYQPHLGMGVAPQTVTIMLFWLIICFTGLVGPVANIAHLAGLLGGVTFAYVPYALKRMPRR